MTATTSSELPLVSPALRENADAVGLRGNVPAAAQNA